MCEIPSNVICADPFSDIFDGFSIGSNDLTQLTLGLDRDSALVAHLYDERNEAVKRLVAQVIKVAKGKKAQDRDLRPGAQRFPGIRDLPGGMRHRLHQPDSRHSCKD